MIVSVVRRVWRGHRAVVLATLLAVVLLGSGAMISLAHADVVGSGSVPVVSVGQGADVGKPGEKCSDDSECFNPCTMGVNGEYPEGAPEYYVPGPCRLDTVLPYGLRFQLIAEPVDGKGVVCGPGRSFVQVTVLVVNPDVSGDIRAEKYGYGCARGGDPFADFAGVLPWLLREAAGQLDV